MTVDLNTTTPIPFVPIERIPVQIAKDRQSFWDKHKIRVMVTTAVLVATISAIVFYVQTPKPGCVEGFFDDLAVSNCKNGKFERDMSLCMPQCYYEKYRNLIESCKQGDKIPGCFHKNYYRELTPECKANPIATLCDGNYDHAEWVNVIYSWMDGSWAKNLTKI